MRYEFLILGRFNMTQLACGVWSLIEHGINEYVRQHGRKPLALILHPAHANEFCSGAESDDAILDGIAVIQYSRVTGPNLIDEHGDTFEI
jgi:hypothetical protein